MKLANFPTIFCGFFFFFVVEKKTKFPFKFYDIPLNANNNIYPKSNYHITPFPAIRTQNTSRTKARVQRDTKQNVHFLLVSGFFFFFLFPTSSWFTLQVLFFLESQSKTKKIIQPQDLIVKLVLQKPGKKWIRCGYYKVPVVAVGGGGAWSIFPHPSMFPPPTPQWNLHHMCCSYLNLTSQRF